MLKLSSSESLIGCLAGAVALGGKGWGVGTMKVVLEVLGRKCEAWKQLPLAGYIAENR